MLLVLSKDVDKPEICVKLVCISELPILLQHSTLPKVKIYTMNNVTIFYGETLCFMLNRNEVNELHSIQR